MGPDCFEIFDRPTGGFVYEAGSLRCRGVAIGDLADRFGTPLYVYDGAGIRGRYQGFERAFGEAFSAGGRPARAARPEVHFAAKACGNVRILRDLVGLGAGIDTVSGGEIERAWLAGCPMERVAFAGVGKSEAELRAALDGRFSPLAGTETAELFGAGDPAARGPVGLFNVESEGEFERLDRLAKELGVPARVALRVNPDIDAKTHPYTTTGRAHNKFGIDLPRAERLYRSWSRGSDGSDADKRAPGAHPVGLHVHIGSPVYDAEPFAQAGAALVEAAGRLRDAGCAVGVLDLGGGWPSAYEPAQVRDLSAFADAVASAVRPEIERGTAFHLEPGRSIIANQGVLLTRVEYVKPTADRRFVVCDAGMHTLLRPALYKASHAIWPVRCGAGPFADEARALCDATPADIVGPICETGDFLALDRPLPAVEPGACLAVFGAGAYGMSMASTYNQHTRPAEVLIDGSGEAVLIRRREHPAELLAQEVKL